MGCDWSRGLTKETDERIAKQALTKTRYIPLDECKKLYWDDQFSLSDIGLKFHISPSALFNKFYAAGISLRTKKDALNTQRSIEKNRKFNKENHSLDGRRPQDLGIPGWNKGLTKDTDPRIAAYAIKESVTMSGKPNTFKGKHFTLQQKKNLSDAHKNASPETIKKWIKNMSKAGCSPNKLESKLESLLAQFFPNDWKYTGDGSFVIGGLCPDFVNINGKKSVIELFGEHWHELDDENKRKTIFGTYGFSALVIWGKEMKNPDNVVNKIKSSFYIY